MQPRMKSKKALKLNPKFFGRFGAFQNAVTKSITDLKDATNAIFDEVERLTGLVFSRDFNNYNRDICWYSLGAIVSEDDETIKSECEKFDGLLEYLRYASFSQEFSLVDAETIEDRVQKIENLYKNNPKGLSRAYIPILKQVNHAIKHSLDPNSPLNRSSDSDLNIGRISINKYHMQKSKIITNTTKLFELMNTISNKAINTSDGIPRDQLCSALNTIQEELKQVNATGLNAELENLLTDAGVEKSQISSIPLPEAIKIWGDIMERKKEKFKELNKAFFSEIVLAFPDFNQFNDFTRDYFSNEVKIESILKELEQHIYDTFMGDSTQVTALKWEEAERMIEAIRQRIIKDLSEQHIEKLTPRLYEEALASAQTLPSERQIYYQALVFYLLCNLPTQSTLIEWIMSYQPLVDQGNEVYTREAHNKLTKIILDHQDSFDRLKNNLSAQLRSTISSPTRVGNEVYLNLFRLNNYNHKNINHLVDTIKEGRKWLQHKQNGNDAKTLISKIDQLLDYIQNFEDKTDPRGEGAKKLKTLAQNNLVQEQLAINVLGAMKENYNKCREAEAHASKMLSDIIKFREKQGQAASSDYTTQPISNRDRNKLKSKHQLSDNITPIKLKIFGYTLATRDSLTIRFLENELKTRNSPITPYMTRSDIKTYLNADKNKRKLSADAKLAFLNTNPALMNAEALLLCTYFDFTEKNKLEDSSITKTIIRTFEEIDFNLMDRKVIARSVWKSLKSCFDSYDDIHNPEIYEQNRNNFERKINRIFRDRKADAPGWLETG